MAYNPKSLFKGVPNTTIQTVYTVPANAKAILKNITMCNVSQTTTATVTVWVNARAVIYQKNILPGATDVFDGSIVLDTANDVIQVIQSVASAIEMTISGVEVV